ncbi:hypothetical protein I0Q91_11840 [Halanaerobiaceae bacterium Z-7014]|uniref:YqgF/RNase H-like domain-containing protein n=1 Tax=Halonatronomonas betaini TaxID=2778430 RepID=A0A931ARQ7_9FIRM|nr:hypothetical protein [Halonatronomonas betaini]MBF8437778.1 hypothetical protein [Halonatronomonas betaini]
MSRILAIDPGQDKAGLALTDGDGEPIWLGILAIENFAEEFEELFDGELSGQLNELEVVVIGDGTGSEVLEEIIKSVLKSETRFIKINEWGSTDEAIELYRQYEKTGSIKNIFFKIFNWRPESPIDQYAALVLARRYLKKYQK